MVVDHRDRATAGGEARPQRAGAAELAAVEQHRDIELGQRLVRAHVPEWRVLAQEIETAPDRIRVDDVDRLAQRAQQMEQSGLGAEAIAVGILVTGQQERMPSAQ